MSEWQRVKLGNVCKIKYGKDHKKLADGNVPVYGSGGIMRYVDTAIHDKPSVLIPRKGSLDNLFFAKPPFWTVDTIFWTDIFTDKVDSTFLYYKLITEKLSQYNEGTAVPSLTTAVLNEVEVPLPPLDEQKRIAQILSSLDDKIENNNAINKNLEEQAQAIFKSWFVDFEPFGGTMPSDWRDGILGEIADIVMGQSPSGSSYNEEKNGTVFYQGRAEFGWRFPLQRLFTTEPKRLAQKNDILMSVRAPVGDINIAYEDCCIGRGLSGLRSNSGSQSYLLYLMKSLHEVFQMHNGTGTVFGSINKESLHNIKVTIPNDDYINKFEEIVSAFDKHILCNTEEIRNLSQLRDTLLPKLMSGDLRV